MSLLFGFLLLPLLSSIAVLILKNCSNNTLKYAAALLSALPFLMLLTQKVYIGSSIEQTWFHALNIQFDLKIDSLALIFLYLTSLIIPISIMSINPENLQKPFYLYIFIFILQLCLMIFFMARDLVVFTVFWEAMLLPLYFIIAIWGKENREKTAFKFLLYMIAGSVLMVIGVISLFLATDTFNIDQIATTSKTLAHSKWILFVFLLAFSVKTPLFPFHAWLPDTYANAPIAGTILLSALLSKAGIYGIIRIGFEIFPIEIQEWSPYLITLSVAGVFYGGFAAWKQIDFKRLIAYSSLSHVNFILTALFIWNQNSHIGAILQVINHSITITALFLSISWLEIRVKTTNMHGISGLAKYFPKLCWLTLFFVLSSVALPGLNNFIGEFLIFFGILTVNPWLAAGLGLSIVLSVIYMLRFMQKVFFGPPCFYQNGWNDISRKEIFISIPLIILTLVIGIYPKPFLNTINSITNKTIYENKEVPQ